LAFRKSAEHRRSLQRITRNQSCRLGFLQIPLEHERFAATNLFDHVVTNPAKSRWLRNDAALAARRAAYEFGAWSKRK
jgi:hypothetical protein